jgi:hypothetical protein
MDFAEIDQCRPVFWDSHWLEIWPNHFCPSMGPNGGSVAMDSAERADTLLLFLLNPYMFSVVKVLGVCIKKCSGKKCHRQGFCFYLPLIISSICFKVSADLSANFST